MFSFLKKNELKISFVVIAYNKEQYIRECMNSILTQDIEKEIICVDDYSTDKTYEILLEYQSKYKEVKVIRNPKNLGTCMTRYIGLQNCKGEYALMIDADDSLIKNTIPNIYEESLNNKSDIVEYSYKIKTDNNTKEIILPKQKIKTDLLKAHVDRKIHNQLWNKLISKKVYTKALHKLNMTVEHDNYSDVLYFLYIMLQLASNVYQTDIIGYNYYNDRTGMTAVDSNLQKYLHYCMFYKTYEVLIREYGETEELQFWRNYLCNQMVATWIKLSKSDQTLRNKQLMRKIMSDADIHFLTENHIKAKK